MVSLGVKPVMLSAFRMNGSPYVFAALDRPAVVHEHNGKLVFSPLNETNLTHLCTFSTQAFPGAIAMCKDDRLMITAIDAIQRLHIRCGSSGSVSMQWIWKNLRLFLFVSTSTARECYV